MSTISKWIHKVFVFLDSFRYRIRTNPFAPGRNWKERNLSLFSREKLERKGQNWKERTFLFAPEWKWNKREHFYLLQAKVERKGINPSFTFVLISTWNISFCAREKVEQKGMILFASGKNWNEKEGLFIFRQKWNEKKRFYYFWKHRTKRNKYTSFHLRTNQPRSPHPFELYISVWT